MKLTAARVLASFNNALTNYSANTQRAYRSDLACFSAYRRTQNRANALLGLLSVGRTRAATIAENYYLWLQESRRLSHSSRRRRMNMLQTFVSHARRDRLVNWRLEVPMSRIRAQVDERERRLRFVGELTLMEKRILWKYLERDRSPAGARDFAMIALSYLPMLRLSEIAALNLRDIDLKKNEVRLGTRRQVRMPVPVAISGIIRRWITIRNRLGPGPLFTAFRPGPNRPQLLTKDRLAAESIRRITLERGLGARIKTKLRPLSLRRLGAIQVVDYCLEKGFPLSEALAVTRLKSLISLVPYMDRSKRVHRETIAAICNGLPRGYVGKSPWSRFPRW